MTADLVAFLRARLAEDEQIAKAATAPHNGRSPRWDLGSGRAPSTVNADGLRVANVTFGVDAEHIARHDPQTVLADVAARWLLVDWAEQRLARTSDPLDPATGVLRALAVRYSGHRDHSTAWFPSLDEARWTSTPPGP